MRFKKFASLAISAAMTMSLLTGCSLVETNYGKYYTETVAIVSNKKTGREETITKREFLEAYQNYGYNYVQYYSYTTEQAIDLTIELLENRKITLIAAEDEFGINQDGQGLSKKEKTYLYDQVVSSLLSNLNSYYEDIVPSDDEDETSDAISFTGYTKNAILDGDNIVNINKTEDLLAGVSDTEERDFNKASDYNEIYKTFLEKLVNENYKKALRNYYKDLILAEYGQKYSTDQKSVFEREINRLYKVVYQNYVINKYSQVKKTSLENVQVYSSVTANQIVDLYTSKVRSAFVQYEIEQDSDYDSDISSDVSSVYYFKTDADSTKYFTVANILVKFNTEQQALYDSYTAKYNQKDGGYSYTQYKKDIDDLYDSLMPTTRKLNDETGNYEEYESDLTITELVANLKTEIDDARKEGDSNKIGDIINKYIYSYNEDPGMFNATNNYVIGVDKDGNAVSSFVEEFNNAGLALYDGGNGQLGDVSALTRSQYGIHILVYTGECKNLFDGITTTFELNNDAIQLLYSTRVNPLVDKTYFDVLYDEIWTDNYSNFEKANLEYIKQDYKITEFVDRLKLS